MTKFIPSVEDFFAEMLLRGQRCTIDELLALCPDEPLADLDDRDLKWMTAREHAKWWKRVANLGERYPGFQSAYWKLEHMKYGHCFGRGPLPDRPLPDASAPLVEFVRARISHAKALWSRDISARWTELPFREWLMLHINGETWISPVWPDKPGWSAALQILRVACGFPAFDPTITWELRAPPPRLATKRRVR